jgi:uncharacterized peroxidase-related enzyme
MSATQSLVTLPLLTRDTASPRATELLDATQRKMGFVPNMYAAMANAPGALEAYLLGYERFRTGSGFTAPEQETVFLVISFENECRYCMAAHSFVAEKMSHVPAAVLTALRTGAEIPDAKLRTLADFTRALLRLRGRPTTEDLRAFLHAGYTERQVLELVLAIAVKTISNYTNHLFDTPLDAAFQAHQWSAPVR